MCSFKFSVLYYIWGLHSDIQANYGCHPMNYVETASPGRRIFCPTFILAAWEAHFGRHRNAGTTGLR